MPLARICASEEQEDRRHRLATILSRLFPAHRSCALSGSDRSSNSNHAASRRIRRDKLWNHSLRNKHVCVFCSGRCAPTSRSAYFLLLVDSRPHAMTNCRAPRQKHCIEHWAPAVPYSAEPTARFKFRLNPDVAFRPTQVQRGVSPTASQWSSTRGRCRPLQTTGCSQQPREQHLRSIPWWRTTTNSGTLNT